MLTGIVTNKILSTEGKNEIDLDAPVENCPDERCLAGDSTSPRYRRRLRGVCGWRRQQTIVQTIATHTVVDDTQNYRLGLVSDFIISTRCDLLYNMLCDLL